MIDVPKLIDAIASDLKGKKAVIGISGGKDSSIAAALLALALGKENVIGISMPNGDGSRDEPYVAMLEKAIGIKIYRRNINKMYLEGIALFQDSGLEVSEDTKINLPARIRMSVLFAFAQSIPGSRVVNTCNLSEDVMGYSTLFGDLAGSYAPLKIFTVTEIRGEIGQWLIKNTDFPGELVWRTPEDGLSGKTDEEKLGMSYSEIDQYIRTGKFEVTNQSDIVKFSEIIAEIKAVYARNKFKLEIVNIPGPSYPMPGKNYLTMEE